MLSNKVTQLSWVYQLYRLGQSGGLRDKPQQLQQALLEHIVEGFGASSGTLALADEDGRSLTVVAGIGIPAHVMGSRIEFGCGILGLVAETGKPLLLNGDVSADARFRNMAVRDVSPRPRSAMCWPLTIDNRLIGVFSVNRYDAAEPYTDEDLENGAMIVSLIALVLENCRLLQDQERRIAMLSKMNEELRGAYQRLEELQNQLLHSEKMASIGQLAAGVAHEINNPIGYVNSNLGTLENYVGDLVALLDAYERAETAPATDPGPLDKVRALKARIDIDYLKRDIFPLLAECKDGLGRVKKIIQDLRDFSRADASEQWQWADLHKGLDSTLNIVWNEIKYKAEVVREYGEIPEIECLPSQLNQVFMNILLNAAQAIEERGTITLRTGRQGEEVWVEISDTGKGIAPEHLKRIFDPFFTTKPVGKGTGLGLSISYGIVQRHRGRIEVQSEPGKGATFRVWLPIQQSTQDAAARSIEECAP